MVGGGDRGWIEGGWFASERTLGMFLCVCLIANAVSRLQLCSKATGVEQIVGIFDLRGFQVPRNADFVFAAFMVRLTLGMFLCDAFDHRGLQVPRNADFVFAAFMVRMVVACEGSRLVMWLQRSAGTWGFVYAASMASVVDACGDSWGRKLPFSCLFLDASTDASLFLHRFQRGCCRYSSSCLSLSL